MTFCFSAGNFVLISTEPKNNWVPCTPLIGSCTTSKFQQFVLAAFSDKVTTSGSVAASFTSGLLSVNRCTPSCPATRSLPHCWSPSEGREVCLNKTISRGNGTSATWGLNTRFSWKSASSVSIPCKMSRLWNRYLVVLRSTSSLFLLCFLWDQGR